MIYKITVVILGRAAAMMHERLILRHDIFYVYEHTTRVVDRYLRQTRYLFFFFYLFIYFILFIHHHAVAAAVVQ